MTDYIFLMRGGNERTAALDSEQTQEYMAQWKSYMGGLGATGKLKGGAPFADDGHVISGENRSTRDQPAGGEDRVTGYITLSADDLDDAKSMAAGCPIYNMDGSLEIRQCLDMG
jgi:hypothetical protein